MYNAPNDTRGILNSTSPLKPCTPCSVKNSISQNSNLNGSSTLANPERRVPSNLSIQYKNQINFNPNMKSLLNNPDTGRYQISAQQVKNQSSLNLNMINTFNSPDMRGPQISSQAVNLPNFNSNLMSTLTNPNTRRPQNSTQVKSQPRFESNVMRNNVPEFGTPQNSIPQMKPCTPCSAKNKEIEQIFPQAQDGRANRSQNSTQLMKNLPRFESKVMINNVPEFGTTQNSIPQMKPCSPCFVKNNVIKQNVSEAQYGRANRPQSSTQINSSPRFESNVMRNNVPEFGPTQNSIPQMKPCTPCSVKNNVIEQNFPQAQDGRANRPQNSTQIKNPPRFKSNVMRNNVPEFGTTQNSIPQMKPCTPSSVKNNVIKQNFPQAQDGRNNFQGNFHPSQQNLSENLPSNAFVEKNNRNFTNTLGINSDLNNTLPIKSNDFDELIQAFSSDNQETNKSTKLPNNRGKASFQIKKLKESDFDELMKVLADDHCYETSSNCSSSHNGPVTNDMRKSSGLKLESSEGLNQTDATKISKFDVGLNRTFLIDDYRRINEEIRNSLNDTRKVGKLSVDSCKDSAQNRTTGNSDYGELIRAFTDEINNKTGQSTPDFNNNTPDKSVKSCCSDAKETKTSGYDKLIEIFSSSNNDKSNRQFPNQARNNEVKSGNVSKLEDMNIPEKSDVMKTLKAQQNYVESEINSEKEMQENVSLTSKSQNSGITSSDNRDELLQVFSGKCESDFNNMRIDDPQCQKCPSRKSVQERANKKDPSCHKCPSQKCLQERANKVVKEAVEVEANPLPVSRSTHVISLLNQLAPTPLKDIPPKKEETEEEMPLMNEQINCALKKIQEVDSIAADLFLNLIGEEKQCPNRKIKKRMQNVMRKLSVDEGSAEKGKTRPNFYNPNIQRSIMNSKRMLKKKAARKYSCKDSPLTC